MREVRPVFVHAPTIIRCVTWGYLMTVLLTSVVPRALSAQLPVSGAPVPVQRPCHLSIAREPLSQALVQLAEECGLQFAHLAHDGSGHLLVGPLSGVFTRKAALRRLLHATPLTYRFINDHTVAIVSRNAVTAARRASPHRLPDARAASQRKAARGRPHGMLSRFLAFFALCGFLSFHAGHACAKGAAGDSLTAVPTLQEVVVTAQRRAVNMQSTSVSETAVSGSAILNQHIDRISDLETQVPGLSVTTSGFTENINIRGMGNTTASPTVTTGVPVFRDGLYEPEAILLTEPFYDIHDVEILRGPQGTIIGQNSTGGAVVINSNNPNFRGVNGYAQLVAGDYGRKRIDGAVNLPINHELAARLAFNVEKRHSFFQNIGPQIGDANAGVYSNPGHINEKNMRLGLLFKPSRRFRALLKIEINDLSTGGLTPRPLPPCSSCSPAASFYQYGYNGPSVYNGFHALGIYQLDYNTPEMQHDTADRYGLHLRYILPGGITLRSLTGYQVLHERRIDDVDASAAPVGTGGKYWLQNIGRDPYYSQEFDLISPNIGRVTWLAGVSYFYRSTPVDTIEYPYGALPEPGSQNANIYFRIGTHVHLFGAFGQIDWQILHSLRLQVGARYSDDGQTTSGAFTIPGPGIVISNVGRYSKSVPSGKVALNWTPLRGQHFYVFWARGFKDGGINNAQSDFAPEYVNDYEMGWKGQFLEHHLRTQLGGYYMQYDNMQQQVLNPLGGGNIVINLGNSKIDGLEFSSQARLGGWQGDIGLAYNHSVLGAAHAIASYELPAGVNTNLPQCASAQTSGCNDYTPYILNLNGEADPYSPQFQGNVSLSYIFDLGESRTLAPRVTYSYTGSQWASIFQNTGFYRLSARRLLDLYLSFGYRSWNVQFYVHNATAATYIEGIGGGTGQAGTPGNDAFWGNPRTWGVSVETTF